MDLDAVRARLIELGAARVAHPGGSLARHLSGTYEELLSLNAPHAWCLAGLCHAIYGTDGMSRFLVPPSARGEVRALVGVDAEALLFLYSITDQTQFVSSGSTTSSLLNRFTGAQIALSDLQLRALLAIWLANELDLLVHADAHWLLDGGPAVWSMLQRNEQRLLPGGTEILQRRIENLHTYRLDPSRPAK